MEQLGRVNLLVGTNNCGKTSVLEAISILMEQGSLIALRRSLSRRGEIYDDENVTKFEVEHLFHGHLANLGAMFAIDGRNADNSRRVEVRVGEPSAASTSAGRTRTGMDRNAIAGLSGLAVTWIRDGLPQEVASTQITESGRNPIVPPPRPASEKKDPAVIFITTEALSRAQVLSFLEDAMLTPEEDTVLAALRTIEPALERIAPVGVGRVRLSGYSRGGVAVKLAGQRVPIGSLGDGIWRLLGIALALVRARGGVLLVDEIDTGLHYSVLERMWHLVYETAKRLDVQVFATTHSRDCYESLAAIAHPTGHDVTIQRIERGKPLAVAFSEAEIVQAARRGIEVR